jgi:hypothetical protein
MLFCFLKEGGFEGGEGLDIGDWVIIMGIMKGVNRIYMMGKFYIRVGEEGWGEIWVGFFMWKKVYVGGDWV